MRVMLVIDVYPPSRAGGATIYTVNLAEELAKRGIEVDVLCAGSWSEGRSHFNGVSMDIVNGVRVHRIHLNWRQAPAPFDYLYDNITLAGVFRELLSRIRPDIVHVHSCLTLSARIIEESLSLRLPTILHLHDYWFLCALQNLVRKDGNVCEGPSSAWNCQACVLSGTKALRWTGCLLPDRIQQKLITFAGRYSPLTRLPGLIGMLGNMARRQAYLRRMLASVDAVTTHSFFLTSMFRRHGFRVDHFVPMPLGFDFAWVQKVRPVISERVRFGYIGHLQKIKGVHTLVRAFAGLPRDIQATLEIYGDPTQEPEYIASLRSYDHPALHWRGPFARPQLPDILSNLDVVVVPSICYEVCPTVVREAFAAGIPVIASNSGGVTEMIENGVSGLLFRSGDEDDLRDHLVRLINDHNLLYWLKQGVPRVISIAENTDELLEFYSQLISRCAARTALLPA